MRALLAGISAASVTLAYGPSVAAIGPVRRRLLPGWCGQTRTGHVALTFDDGPDPATTPAFLRELDRLGVRATFFVLGVHLARSPELGRHIAESGHEIAVHGWMHRPHVLRDGRSAGEDVRRGFAVVRSLTGEDPQFWRPPHGIPTRGGMTMARRLGMRMVLWTTDGRDWRAYSSGRPVVRHIERHLDPGGVILLHDTDLLGQTGAWRNTLQALPEIVAICRTNGWALGPLNDHYGP